MRAGLRRPLLVAQAKGEIDAKIGATLAQIESGDFWAQFLAKAGPDAAPELSPYEQRYVLTKLRQEGGPLSAGALDIHYGKHHNGYVTKTNEVIKETPRDDRSLEGIIKTAW